MQAHTGGYLILVNSQLPTSNFQRTSNFQKLLTTKEFPMELEARWELEVGNWELFT
jgi:hypothetical protein